MRRRADSARNEPFRLVIAGGENPDPRPREAPSILASTENLLGRWAGRGDGGKMTATIRRGRANPAYLVSEIELVGRNCMGSVKVYGKLVGSKIAAESYDPADPSAPVCKMELELIGHNKLKVSEGENCHYNHGMSCAFDGNMTRR